MSFADLISESCNKIDKYLTSQYSDSDHEDSDVSAAASSSVSYTNNAIIKEIESIQENIRMNQSSDSPINLSPVLCRVISVILCDKLDFGETNNGPMNQLLALIASEYDVCYNIIIYELIPFLSHDSDSSINFALGILVDISSLSHHKPQVIIDSGLANALKKLLISDNHDIMLKSLWIIHNFSAPDEDSFTDEQPLPEFMTSNFIHLINSFIISSTYPRIVLKSIETIFNMAASNKICKDICLENSVIHSISIHIFSSNYQIVNQACLTLSILIEENDTAINEFISCDCIQKLNLIDNINECELLASRGIEEFDRFDINSLFWQKCDVFTSYISLIKDCSKGDSICKERLISIGVVEQIHSVLSYEFVKSKYVNFNSGYINCIRILVNLNQSIEMYKSTLTELSFEKYINI